jgi:SAM-dependent methyltransferase
MLSFADDSFEIIYCISVLEHACNFETVVAEFERVLKPTGLLIVTFDISLDGEADIPIDRATTLLRLLNTRFRPQERGVSLNVSAALADANPVTSFWCRETGLGATPWRSRSRRALEQLFGIRTRSGNVPRLTIYCASFFKAR